MKLTAILITAACLQVAAKGHSQAVTLSLKDAPLQKVFSQIEGQTGYLFFFNADWMQKATPVTIQVKDVDLKDALDICFQNQPLSYAIVGKTIVLKLKESLPVTSDERAKQSLPPPIDIRGRVVNEKGEPVAGVTVSVKGTKIATSTNSNGEFSLKGIDEKATLIFSATNIEGFEINVNGKTELVLNAKTKFSPLDEVHVIAYGTTTQRFSVGSQSKITAEDISKQPIANPLAALEGKVPGLVVNMSSGIPGASIQTQIRGQNSLKVNPSQASVVFDNPLFIIDGVPFSPQNSNINQYASVFGNGAPTPGVSGAGSIGVSPFNSINPADIESIEVLKDADATAIYGSRGANGVILISTKKGRVGKTTFSSNLWTGTSRVSHTLPIMNTSQYLSMRREAYKNDGITPNTTVGTPGYAPDLLIFDTTRNTNWKNYFIGGTAQTTDANLSLSGGTSNTQFFIGVGSHYETYIFPGDYSDNRVSVNANFQHSSINRKLFVNFSANYSYDRNNSIRSSSVLQAFTLPPNYPDLLNSDGSLNWSYKGVDLSNNPVSYLKQPYVLKNHNLISHLDLGYQILPGLTLRSSFGYNTFNANEYTAVPKIAQDPNSGNPSGYASFGTNNFETWIVEPQMEFKRSIGRGKLDILLGGTFQQNTNTSTNIYASNYGNDLLINSIAGAAATSAFSGYSLYKYSAAFGRINYVWNSKYIFDVTARRDGSSRFGPGKQFGNFGSIGGGWLFSEEKFIKRAIPALSYGKIRASYGSAGNDNIGDYQFLSVYAPIQGASFQNSIGYNPQGLYNPDFSWSLTKKFEIGTEVGFLRDNLLFDISWFQNRSGNQLVSYIVPRQTGFNSITKNAPYVVQNTGLELQINSTNIKRKQFTWNTSINLTIPKNKLLSFPDINTSPYASIYVVGKSLTSIQKFKYLGVNDTTGIFQFVDVNHDGILNPSPVVFGGDYQLIGNLDPNFYGGLNNSFTYKGIQLSIFLQFTKQMGVNYLQQIYGNNSPGSININEPAAVLSRWQSPGDNAAFQRFTSQVNTQAYTAAKNFVNSSGGYSDASYIRCKTISLSYSLPIKYLKKMRMSACRIYINAQNLFTITHYNGMDPENQNIYSLPPLRSVVTGLQLTF